MQLWVLFALVFSFVYVGSCLPTKDTEQLQTKNVLFTAVDDLRTELGTYGHAQVMTPNFDSLSSKSLVFERAYCQVAVCSPSRTSLLTGRTRDTNHVWKIAPDEYWRKFTNATTIPQYFKENGYVSVGMGKVFHPRPPNGFDDESFSWCLPYYHSPLVTTRIWWQPNLILVVVWRIWGQPVTWWTDCWQCHTNLAAAETKSVQRRRPPILPCHWISQATSSILCSSNVFR